MTVIAAYLALGLAVILIALLIAEAERMPSLVAEYRAALKRPPVHITVPQSPPVFLPSPVAALVPVFDPACGRWRHPVTKRFLKAPLSA